MPMVVLLEIVYESSYPSSSLRIFFQDVSDRLLKVIGCGSPHKH